MNVTPAQRRMNLLLFVGLVLFAVALCAAVLLWMRHRTREQGGKVYPAAIYQSRNLSVEVRGLQSRPDEWGHAASSHLRKSA